MALCTTSARASAVALPCPGTLSATSPRSAPRPGWRAGEQTSGVRRHTVDHHGARILAFREPHGQARVIRQDRVDPDQDRVVPCTKMMGHRLRQRIGEPQHPARPRGDGTIERLRVSERDVRRSAARSHVASRARENLRGTGKTPGRARRRSALRSTWSGYLSFKFLVR